MHIPLLHAVVLGIIQGATEFLPVSSSAHLVIFQHIFKLDIEAGPMVAFDVCLHVGTLFAVLLALRKEIVLIASSGNLPRTTWLIVLGTLPAVILGLSFKDFFEHLFTTLLPVGGALIITGIILFATRIARENNILLPDMKWRHALMIGLSQAVAIIPGISRSGSTISMGLFAKLDRELAAKFSFLLSIPAISGAAILEWENFRYISQDNMLAVILGALAAFIVGYISIRFMLAIMNGARFSWFAIYCWAVGLATIIYSLIP